MQEMERSYREALRALNGSKSRVIHIEDLSQNGVYDEEFPVEMEKSIFRYLEEGKEKECVQEMNEFFDWMLAHYAEDMNNIRLKVLEYIIWGEKKAFEAGAVNYGFSYRRDYLDVAMACKNYEELRKWFLDKMVNACRAIRDQKEERSNSVAKKAMLYIQENYSKDISLDDVSGLVNISPYYFSKIFKEETGENFIEYLTKIRIEKAKWGVDEMATLVSGGTQLGYTPSGMESGFELSALFPDYSMAGMPEWTGYILSAVVGVALLVIFFKIISSLMKDKVDFNKKVA